jgi:hypothetical protein
MKSQEKKLSLFDNCLDRQYNAAQKIMIPDRVKPRYNETAGYHMRRRVAKAAVAGSILLSACGSGNGAISPSTFVIEANNYSGQTVVVGPLTANDFTSTKASFTIHGKRYTADQLGGGNPYLVALVPDNEQKKIFGQKGKGKTVFLHGTIFLRGVYENVTTNSGLLGPVFLSSGVDYSS